MSFLTFYLRLSPKQGFRRLVWIGLAANTAMLIFNELLSILQCKPFIAVLKPFEHPEAKCVERLVVFYIPASLNTLLDIYILLLPIHSVWKLRMPLRKKIAILSVFTFGIFTLIVSFVRFYVLVSLNSAVNTSDGVGQMLIVAALEFNFALLALNLPATKCLCLKMTGGCETLARSASRSRKALHGRKRGACGLRCLRRKSQKKELNELDGKNISATGITVTRHVVQESSESTQEDAMAENAQRYRAWEYAPIM
ncbi:hypothetical protein N0V90_012850 [Kalmusia sp. IMI 367209]|nr:hypothetical protein N0V90_012850 [Kalmusia sp. IMI 367209]